MISTEQVIKKIKLFSEMPEDNNFLYKNDSDFLEVINSTFLEDIFPIYKDIDKNFFLSYIDFPLTETNYSIPSDAYNRVICEVQIISSSKNVVENIPQISFSSDQSGFMIIGNEVVLQKLNNFSNGERLRIWYHSFPPSLALSHLFSPIEHIYDSNKKIISNLIQDFHPYGFSIEKGKNKFIDSSITNVHADSFQLCLQKKNDAQNIINLVNQKILGEKLSCFYFSSIEETEERWIVFSKKRLPINTHYIFSVGNIVNFAPLPLDAVSLLVLRTIINMDVSERVKKIAFHRYSEQLSMLRDSSKKNRFKKKSIPSKNLLW